MTTDPQGAATRQHIECPRCGWRPRPQSRWRCECGHTWNTFDTRGVCPSCGKTWTTTFCPNCGESPDHQTWYFENPPERTLVSREAIPAMAPGALMGAFWVASAIWFGANLPGGDLWTIFRATTDRTARLSLNDVQVNLAGLTLSATIFACLLILVPDVHLGGPYPQATAPEKPGSMNRAQGLKGRSYWTTVLIILAFLILPILDAQPIPAEFALLAAIWIFGVLPVLLFRILRHGYFFRAFVIGILWITMCFVYLMSFALSVGGYTWAGLGAMGGLLAGMILGRYVGKKIRQAGGFAALKSSALGALTSTLLLSVIYIVLKTITST